MVELIKTLVDKGYAYERGDVYFRVAAFANYGRLSGRRGEDQEARSRVAASEEKEDPLDFVLWKKAKPGEPKWPSPWGEGRPGWHTECVVLSRQYLGEPLDIHAGGNDLVFPHHENEIAQAEAATGRPFFRFFIHNGMLNFGGEKMSKSLGNFAFAYQVLEKFDAQTIRYFYLSRHYRKPLDYSDEGLEEAKKALARIKTLIEETKAELGSAAKDEPGPAGKEFLELLPGFRARYVAEMESDLNTVGAIAAIQELVAEANRFRSTAQGADRLVLRDTVLLIRELGWPLGLFQEQGRVEKGLEDDLMRLLIDLRAELRKKKEFALADSIRDRLAALGVELKDTAQGTIWT
jgi:cysteinyl-tRNA synthetase